MIRRRNFREGTSSTQQAQEPITRRLGAHTRHNHIINIYAYKRLFVCAMLSANIYTPRNSFSFYWHTIENGKILSIRVCTLHKTEHDAGGLNYYAALKEELRPLFALRGQGQISASENQIASALCVNELKIKTYSFCMILCTLEYGASELLPYLGDEGRLFGSLKRTRARLID